MLAYRLLNFDGNPSFTEGAYQSELANVARQVFIDYVEAAPNYDEELGIRWLLMKLKPDSDADAKTNYGKKDKPVVKNIPKLGRNDLCVCGSGKKYKKCCMEK